MSGLPNKTEPDPVIAKTMKILIISQRALTRHLFSRRLNSFKVTKRRKLAMTAIERELTIKFSKPKKVFILAAEYIKPNIPANGYNSCQFLLICHFALNLFILNSKEIELINLIKFQLFGLQAPNQYDLELHL